MLSPVEISCSFCPKTIPGYIDLGQQHAKTFIPQLADPDFIKKNQGKNEPSGIRLVVAARVIFLCFSCIQNAYTKSKPAIIT